MKSSKYVCQQCGYESVGWMGKCPNCGEWNSLVETVQISQSRLKSEKSGSRSTSSNKQINLNEIKTAATKRISTKISELDRVLGGGLVPGQVVLIAGEPGIGKSTLLLQVANQLAGNRHEAIGNKQSLPLHGSKKTSAQSLVPSASVLYVCGEESASQIAIRGQRLGIRSKNIELLEDTDVDAVIESLSAMTYSPSQSDKLGLSAIIVDSIQTMATSDLSGMAGSVGQVRESASRLLRVAKASNIPLFLVGHVTKEGTVAGPAVLAHIVDTVLWFEGDKTLTLRLLRAVKNRFGATDEVGIFEMKDTGLASISDAEKIFLTKAKKEVPGSVVSSILQGSRPLLVEIQSLVVPTKLAFPKRVAQGIDSRRLELMLAVLIRRCGLPLYEYDVFLNVAGGIRVEEPACDLAVCLSIASAFFDKALSTRVIAVGEVGLLGEIREVVAQEKRLKEAKRLGFTGQISSKETKYLQEAVKKYLR